MSKALILLLSFHPSWNQVISNCMIHLSSNFLEDVLGYILMANRRVFTTNKCIFSLNSLRPLILPTLDYIAANLFIKSLPRRGTGHSGIYKKECVIIMGPILQAKGDVNYPTFGCLSTPITVYHGCRELAKSEQSRQLQCLQDINFSSLPHQG